MNRLTATSDLPYAPRWRRFLAALIDTTLFLLMIACVFIAMAAILMSDIVPPSLVEEGAGILFGVAFMLLVPTLLIISPTLQNASKHQGSLGKRCLGIIIVDSYGRRISKSCSFLRQLAKNTFTASTLGIGGLFALFSRKKQTLHDMVTDTYVIMKQKAKAPQDTTALEDALHPAFERTSQMHSLRQTSLRDNGR